MNGITSKGERIFFTVVQIALALLILATAFSQPSQARSVTDESCTIEVTWVTFRSGPEDVGGTYIINLRRVSSIREITGGKYIEYSMDGSSHIVKVRSISEFIYKFKRCA